MRKTLLKLLLTIVLLALVLSQVKWKDLQTTIEQQQALYIGIAFAAIMLQTITGGLRWHQIRHAFNPAADDATRTTGIYYASLFFGFFIPGTFGSDMSRGWMAKKSGEHVRDVVYAVITDRAISLLGLALLVAAMFPWLAGHLKLSMGWGIAAAIVCWLLAGAIFIALRKLLLFIRLFTPTQFLLSMIDALVSVAHKNGPLLRSVFFAFIAHMAYATAAYALLRGINVELGWITCLTLVPLVLFLGSVPVTIGGWGMREIGMVAMLALVGVGKPEALSISIQLGLLGIFNCLLGGLVYLMLPPAQPKQDYL